MPLPVRKAATTNALSRTISKQEILDNLPEYQQFVSFFRWYPDKLIDLYIETMGDACTFRLLDYQRIFLRAMARHKEVYMTFSRGTSKSFVDNLWNIIECILYPNSNIAISATTKGQSGAILESKVSEILSMLPILNFEIRKIEKVKDSYIVHFKNGSKMQNLAAKASSRGLRFTGLVLEEIIEGDPAMIQEVILPTLAIQRRAANGEFDPNEIVTQQKVVVTTAGLTLGSAV